MSLHPDMTVFFSVRMLLLQVTETQLKLAQGGFLLGVTERPRRIYLPGLKHILIQGFFGVT